MLSFLNFEANGDLLPGPLVPGFDLWLRRHFRKNPALGHPVAENVHKCAGVVACKVCDHMTTFSICQAYGVAIIWVHCLVLHHENLAHFKRGRLSWWWAPATWIWEITTALWYPIAEVKWIYSHKTMATPNLQCIIFGTKIKSQPAT